jgi:hypothetical protein
MGSHPEQPSTRESPSEEPRVQQPFSYAYPGTTDLRPRFSVQRLLRSRPLAAIGLSFALVGAVGFGVQRSVALDHTHDRLTSTRQILAGTQGQLDTTKKELSAVQGSLATAQSDLGTAQEANETKDGNITDLRTCLQGVLDAAIAQGDGYLYTALDELRAVGTTCEQVINETNPDSTTEL